MAQLGTTRYGLNVTYVGEGSDSTSKTYSGFNFSAGGASAIANEAQLFVFGDESADFPGLSGLSNKPATDVDVIARNEVLR